MTAKPATPEDASANYPLEPADLNWIFEAERNHYIAPTEPTWNRRLDEPWIDELSYHKLRLRYEPRSLAVSPDCTRVAVGTKSGAVHLAARVRRAWIDAEPCEIRSLHTEDLKPQYQAIRSIVFLDEDTLVVGSGPGTFSVITTAIEDGRLRITSMRSYPGTVDKSYRSHRWFLRFTKITSLRQPGETLPIAGDIAIGTTLTPKLHLLTRDANDWNSRLIEPVEIFEDWPPDTRLVDAGWENGGLWTLNSEGTIARYERPRVASNGPQKFDRGHSIELHRPVNTGEFLTLETSEFGLAVLTTGHVTFVPFLTSGPEAADGCSALNELDIAAISWTPLPDAFDVTVCKPFVSLSQNRRIGPYKEDPLKAPIRLVVCSAEQGLRWIHWIPGSGDRRPKPTAPALHHAGDEATSTLLLSFGKLSPVGPTYLAYATRNHFLHIASLVDLAHLPKELLNQKLKRFLEQDRQLIRLPGIGWHLLQHQIWQSFALKRHVHFLDLESDEIEGLVRFADADHLRRLIPATLGNWRRARVNGEVADERFKGWILLFLTRAQQIRSNLSSELARLAYDSIVERRNLRDKSGRKVWDCLGTFALFLRKWGAFGYTYGEKRFNLLDLYALNKACGYKLDALAHLTRLLRRRIDTEWTVRASADESTPSAWAMAAESNGEFTVQTMTDGRLSAVDYSGRLLKWRFETHPDPVKYPLEIDNEHFLRHCYASAFEAEYRHGPYSRSIELTKLPLRHPSDFLLLIPIRGWRLSGEEYRIEEIRNAIASRTGLARDDIQKELLQPAICGVLFRFDSAQRTLWISGLDMQPVGGEIYGMTPLGHTDEEYRYIAGTAGSLQFGDRQWQICPFIQIDVSVRQAHDEAMIRIHTRAPEVRQLSDGERNLTRRLEAVHEPLYAPCWSLAVAHWQGETPCLWAGFQDGSIRAYRPTGAAGQESWLEVRNWHPPPTRADEPHGDAEPASISLRVLGSVWRLDVFDYGDEPMLAYGTGEGMIGVLPLSDFLKGRNPSWLHVVHIQEKAPVTGLKAYRPSAKELYLFAVTQDGKVTLFNLSSLRDAEPQDKAEENSEQRRLLASPLGARLDRFDLDYNVRAIEILTSDCQELKERVPLLVTVDDEGRVYRQILAFPRGFERRRRAAIEGTLNLFRDHMPSQELAEPLEEIELLRKSQPSNILAQYLGPEKHYEWLRAIDVGDLNLLRFSLWRQLRTERLRLFAKPLEADRIEAYRRTMNDLASAMYRRRPFSADPVKVIWEEGAKVANLLGQMALKCGRSEARLRTMLLGQYGRLNKTIDDLCNRWLGFDHSIESAVLVHVLNQLFHWIDVIFIGEGKPSQEVLHIRGFLIQKMIRRRLKFSDPMVRVETLRILNSRMYQAIEFASASKKNRRQFSLRPLRAKGDPRASLLGLFDLLIIVGDLASGQADALEASDPLWTELARFFAHCIILVPTSALIVEQVIVESRLGETSTLFHESVLSHVEFVRRMLETRSGHKLKASSLTDAVERFRASGNRDVDFSVVSSFPKEGQSPGEGNKSAWNTLLEFADKAGKNPPPLTDEEYALELAAVIRCTSHLVSPGQRESLAVREAKDLLSSGRIRYFRHSVRCLQEIAEAKERIDFTLRASTGPGGGLKQRLEGAISLCNDEIDHLRSRADIFEPQRSWFIEVVRRWREQIRQRAHDALDLLSVLDSFNRHIYRSSADRLMGAVTELVFQNVPIIHSEPRNVSDPLRLEILKRLSGRRLLKEVFSGSYDLVQNTHLSGTLLTVVRDVLHPPLDGTMRRARSEVTLSEVLVCLKEACKNQGLRLRDYKTAVDANEVRVPGNPAVWTTIFQELAKNILKYCSPEVVEDPEERERVARDWPDSTAVRWAFRNPGEVGLAPSQAALYISGNLPFFWSLRKQLRRQLDQLEPPERLKKLRDYALQASRREQRLGPLTSRRSRTRQPAVGPSTGMGLTMITTICRCLSMRGSAELLEPERHDYMIRGPVPNPEEMVRNTPLSFRITWFESEYP